DRRHEKSKEACENEMLLQIEPLSPVFSRTSIYKQGGMYEEKPQEYPEDKI
ncbi:19609_t:CDS:2, partial [Racocetra persica]